MKQLNAISGLAFGCFLILHLSTHYFIFAGLGVAKDVQLKLRVIYQHPVFELLTALSLFVHMYTNLVLYWARQKMESSARSKTKGKTPRSGDQGELTAHRYAGYFLGLSMVGHIGATRVLPMIMLEDPSVFDYTYLTKVIRFFPNYSFAVYLFLLGATGGWHLIYGTRSAIATISGSSVIGKPFPIILKALAMLSHVGILLAVLSLSGCFYVIRFSESQEKWHEILMDTMGF
jgi:hypothetical protein